MKNIADRPYYSQEIIAYRKMAGLTQKQLATATDIPLGTIKTIESGATCPSFIMLYKISKALNTTPDSFMSIDSRLYQTSGLKFYKKEYDKIKRSLPEYFWIGLNCIDGVSFEAELDIIYDPELNPDDHSCKAPIMRYYDMISLVNDVAAIKVKLSQKYKEELEKEIEKLLFKLLKGEHFCPFPCDASDSSNSSNSSDSSNIQRGSDKPTNSQEHKKLGE